MGKNRFGKIKELTEKKREDMEVDNKENTVIDYSDNSKLFRKQLLMITVCVVLVVIIALTGSYAIFSKTSYGNEYNVVYVGDLNFSYVDLSDDGNILSLASSYPIDDASALSTSPYRFSVENTGTLIADYTVKIVQDDAAITADGCEGNLLDLNYLRYKFDNSAAANLSSIVSSTNNKEFIVYEGTLQAYESNIHEIRIWLNETSPNSVLGKHFHGKVVIDIEQNNTTDPYERPVAPRYVNHEAFATENLGNNCTTYDDGVDTFLVGQCSNNYVWYSGKLWRVVLKNNETGAVKMVTDNAITAIPYNASGNTAFKDSYMDQWLNQEFLPTLHDYEDYLVTNSTWDATTDSSTTPTRPAGMTTIERVVGLLNAYEYYTTYAQSGGLATSSTGYLKNGVYWWTLTPSSTSYVRYVNGYGNLYSNSPTNGYGARPSVNLKSTIQIDSGSGSKSNPYILKGDQQETVAGTTLLSTRYSGEYVTFNNELYRIVGVENGLTKITAVDKPSSLSSNNFHSATGVTNFANASIKSDLETYYQGLNETWRNMIQPSTTWYLGGVGSGDSFGNYHYKASICASVDASVSMNACAEKTTSTTANIGLPRVGEMFTSQITRGTKANFWTLTPYSPSAVRLVYDDGDLNGNSPTNGYGARPSMYLKSTIKIASGNTGNGTYEYPYSLSLN